MQPRISGLILSTSSPGSAPMSRSNSTLAREMVIRRYSSFFSVCSRAQARVRRVLAVPADPVRITSGISSAGAISASMAKYCPKFLGRMPEGTAFSKRSGSR